MMHCLQPLTPERQRAQHQWQQQQERNGNSNNFPIENFLSIQGDGWPNPTSSAPYLIGNTRQEEMGTTTTTTATTATTITTTTPSNSSSSKKRKANKSQMDDEEKRMKKGNEGSEGEKKQGSNKSEEEARESSKENNEKKKVDYIHVRARRGQATDSHSLAERVRREKISERMKYLQGLVPGCDKVTGKAGMLDEIINYVQSLQRQVEFLSMKLATVNPMPDFNMETLFSKEMMNNMMACSSPSGNNPSNSMGMQVPEMMLDPSLLLQLNSMHQSMTMNHMELIALQRTISTPEPLITLDSCFNVVQRSPSAGWDSEVHNLPGVEFQQGRGPVFPFHSLQGNLLPNNPKMET